MYSNFEKSKELPLRDITNNSSNTIKKKNQKKYEFESDPTIALRAQFLSRFAQDEANDALEKCIDQLIGGSSIFRLSHCIIEKKLLEKFIFILQQVPCILTVEEVDLSFWSADIILMKTLLDQLTITFPNVKVVELFACNIGDTDLESIVLTLKNWSCVNRIKFGDNKITDVGMNVLANIFEHIPQIEQLHLGNNNFTEKGLDYLLKNANSVKSLGLRDNNLATSHCKVLNKFFEFSGCSLTDLRLRSNKIDNEACFQMVKGLNFLKQLRVLELENNNITGPGAFHLCSALSNHGTNLVAVNFNNNSIGHRGCFALGLLCVRVRSLETIGISGNNLTNDSILPLIKKLTYSNLKGIDISNNRLDIEVIKHLLENHAANIDSIDISHNNLSHTDSLNAGILIGELFKRNMYSHINLNYCGIDDDALAQISRSLPLATCLQRICLVGNELTSDGFTPFIHALESCYSINKISLGGQNSNNISLKIKKKIQKLLSNRHQSQSQNIKTHLHNKQCLSDRNHKTYKTYKSHNSFTFTDNTSVGGSSFKFVTSTLSHSSSGSSSGDSL
eukprot:TRINITY_DN2428_c0_g1_i1.p1 TRINITY_DN2428_c0_g1~~TRINITY_DN2428_c0_g1_i1.p1  ORF type:complete len:562 (+),score=110.03 TRINITY_DN2428_c0_g1_i1:113-1798(+)